MYLYHTYAHTKKRSISQQQQQQCSVVIGMGALLAAVVCVRDFTSCFVLFCHMICSQHPPLSRCTHTSFTSISSSIFIIIVIIIVIIIKFTAMCVWCGGGGGVLVLLVGAVVAGFVFWAVCVVRFVVAAVLFVRDIYIDIHTSSIRSDLLVVRFHFPVYPRYVFL